jgi:uncharacterized metal-binding protein YceD (DUF177 family)
MVMTTHVSDRPWSIPVAVHDIPETGRRFEFVADAQTRSRIAELAGLRDLSRLEASFEVTKQGSGLHVVGRVSALVGQTCVVTLEPIDNEISENVDLVFVSDDRTAAGEGADARGEVDFSTDESTERLVGGTVDLGAVATEFLILGIDPYPRKSGAVFEPPGVDEDTGKPFAALAALKQRPGRNG